MDAEELKNDCCHVRDSRIPQHAAHRYIHLEDIVYARDELRSGQRTAPNYRGSQPNLQREPHARTPATAVLVESAAAIRYRLKFGSFCEVARRSVIADGCVVTEGADRLYDR
jgi:hypothetical protein